MGKFQKKIVVVLLLATLLLTAFWASYPSLLGIWADRLYAQANQADDAEVTELIDRLAALGTPAIPRLTAALGSERRVVAHSVRERLIQMVESWEHPDTRPSAEARLTLAGSLAKRMTQYSPNSQLHAATLARRMLQVSHDGLTQKEASCLVLACESILDASKSATPPHTVEQVATAEAENSTPSEPEPSSIVRSSEAVVPLSERSLIELARLPGGGLPPALPALSSRQLTPEEGGGRSTVPLSRPENGSAPGPFLVEKGRGERGEERGTIGEISSDEQEGGLQRLTKTPALRPIEPSEEGITATTSPRYASSSSPEKSGDRVYSLILQLHSGNQQKADQARRELSLGGFKTVHFALAERLTDPDPMVRKELVQVLPRLKSVRTESWLKWLLKDDDPNVRREALMTLASSKDPMLLAEIAHLAQSDTDPKIRLEGQQIERRLGQ